jgi:hypothetical protein
VHDDPTCDARLKTAPPERGKSIAEAKHLEMVSLRAERVVWEDHCHGTLSHGHCRHKQVDSWNDLVAEQYELEWIVGACQQSR